MSTAEIVARANAHGQLLSLDGDEWGGGPYYLTINRGLSPVVVARIPVWARGWSDVFAALRACLTAWEFAPTEHAPRMPEHTYAKRLWAAASALARAGKPVTCWSILARLHPEPKPRRPRRLPVGRVLTTDTRVI